VTNLRLKLFRRTRWLADVAAKNLSSLFLRRLWAKSFSPLSPLRSVAADHFWVIWLFVASLKSQISNLNSFLYFRFYKLSNVCLTITGSLT
jgi:hypothetical protein